jgi:succinate-semialdehyde dehydrogenase/glutarate-semialdehyde dehydrogenase
MFEKSGSENTTAINPVTGGILGYSPLHTIEDVKNAIETARLAQPQWASLSIKKRIQLMLPIRDYLIQNIDLLAETISRDNGKLRTDAMLTEVLPATIAITYYCQMAKKFLKTKKLRSATWVLAFKRNKIVRVPYGVIGIISPWNYPFGIPFSEVIMALLAGNAVILKTASETQWVGLALQKTSESAGLPAGIFYYLNLPGRIAGAALLEGGIDKLLFTGSVSVGKKLMAKASETLTPICLELGGNDPMIVCEDADPYRAAMGALWAGFQNAGQSCGGVERIYVHEAIYDDFMAVLKEKIENLRVGYDLDFEVDMGAMTTQRQIETVTRHVSDALEKGAKIHAQSKIPENKDWHNFYPATVLTEVNHEMLVMREESFGPVVGVMKFRNIEEAIQLANDSNLGLTASVWSKNRRKAEKIGRQLKAGVISINDHLMSHGLPEAPWGGFKESGIGRTHGEIGFQEMTQPQLVMHDILPFVKKDLWWYPYNAKIYQGLKGIVYFIYGPGLSKRLKGLYNVLKIVFRIFSK